MTDKLAPIYVAATRRNSNELLLNVGGFGWPAKVSVSDLITMCVRRERIRNKTS